MTTLTAALAALLLAAAPASAFSLTPSLPGPLAPSGGISPWVVCPDGTAVEGTCPTAGAPGPAAWAGCAAALAASRRLRRRIREGQR